MPPELQPFSLDRMVRAVELVRERRHRATAVLEAAGIAYAVTGGNAVAAWVTRVDPAAVRYTQDVDLLVRREDFDEVKTALEAAGFVHQEFAFLDGQDGRRREAVKVVFAGEKTRADDLAPAPDVAESEVVGGLRVVSLDRLVETMLASFKREDRMLLRDLVDVGLVDQSWCDRLSDPLAERLQQLLDDPDG